MIELRHGYGFPGLYSAIERGKAEIKHDIREGRVPADVLDFPSLHDFVDANAYGGLHEVGDMTYDEWVAWGNALQSYLDDWLKEGRP